MMHSYDLAMSKTIIKGGTMLDQILDKVIGFVTGYGLDIASAILIFVIGKWLANFVARLLEKIMLKAKVDQNYGG